MLSTEILAALGGRFGGAFSDPRPLAAGQWSRAYALTLNGGEVVVRVGAHGDDYLKDAAAASTFAATRVPVPVVFGSGTAGGSSYAVSERVHGIAFDDLDVRQVARVLPSLLDVLEAIRSVDLARTTGYGIWRPDGAAPHTGWAEALLAIGEENPRLPGWRDALAASPIGSAPLERGLRRLQELVPRLPDVRELIHGDLLSRNVLVSGSRITGVLDWGNSLYGDSLYDVAWLLFWWPWYPQWESVDLHARVMEHLHAGGRPLADLDERLLAYKIHIALDAVAYCAFKERWDEVEAHAETLARLAAS